jgi:hypothetical protein
MYFIFVHDGISSKDERIDVVKNYPSLYEWFLNYEIELKKRTDKGTHWTNLKGFTYLKEIFKEKIVWQRITQKPTFCIAEASMLIADSMGFMVCGENTKYLIALLNSSVIYFYTQQVVHQYGSTGFRLSNQYVENFPIPKLPLSLQTPFISKVDAILLGKSVGGDTSLLESELDVMVYHLYGLSYEEACVIEPGLSYARFV